MKTIGLVGGLGPESTAAYYKAIISVFNKLNGGTAYPDIVIRSVDLNRFMRFVETRDWPGLSDWLLEIIRGLSNAGAEFAAIASNTPHIVFRDIQGRSRLPLISIVDETCIKARELKLKKPGLLGTGLTMKAGFYGEVFDRYAMTVISPLENEQEYIHRKIFSEIEFGIINEETRNGFLSIIERMIRDHKIDSVILGCTELPLILPESVFDIPFLNTTAIHCESIVKFCLEN